MTIEDLINGVLQNLVYELLTTVIILVGGSIFGWFRWLAGRAEAQARNSAPSSKEADFWDKSSGSIDQTIETSWSVIRILGQVISIFIKYALIIMSFVAIFVYFDIIRWLYNIYHPDTVIIPSPHETGRSPLVQGFVNYSAHWYTIIILALLSLWYLLGRSSAKGNHTRSYNVARSLFSVAIVLVILAGGGGDHQYNIWYDANSSDPHMVIGPVGDFLGMPSPDVFMSYLRAFIIALYFLLLVVAHREGLQRR